MASKVTKYYATADILVGGQHVGAGDEVDADQETIKQLERLGRISAKKEDGARAASAAELAKAE